MLKCIFLIVCEVPRGNKCVATFCRLNNILREGAIERGQTEWWAGERHTGAQTERQRISRNKPQSRERKSTFIHMT